MIFGVKRPSEKPVSSAPGLSLPHTRNLMKKHIYCRHSFEIEVPFFDVDAMHIVWHGNYVKYLETARCAFLSAIGYDYNEMALKTPD